MRNRGDLGEGENQRVEEILAGEKPLGPGPENQKGEDTGAPPPLHPPTDEATPAAEAPAGDAVPPDEGPET